METASCEIARLPRELLTAIVSLTSPPDASRAAAVSRAFCAVADTDAVWSCFLTSDLPRFADEGLLPHTPPSTKKGTFLRLSRVSHLLSCRLRSMRLDRFSGAKWYFISARALRISGGGTPHCWEWIVLGGDEIKRHKWFSEAAKLLAVFTLKIRGKIHSRMLSQNSIYGIYLVFKLDSTGFWNLDFPFQEATVNVGGSESTRQVCVQGYDMKIAGDRQRHILSSRWGKQVSVRDDPLPLTDDVILPRFRSDGWRELELGEFYNDEGYDGEVSVSLTETKGGHFKSGLIVWGMEIRSKQGSFCVRSKQ